MFKKMIGLTCVSLILGLSSHASGADPNAWIPTTGSHKPVMDGIRDGLWSYTPEHKLTRTVIGSENLKLSASWRALWDAENLYVFVDVIDASVIGDSAESWQDDSVEIYIDAGNEKLTGFGATDYQYRIAAKPTQSPAIEEYMHGATFSLVGVEYGVAITSTGYSVEVRFPWATLLQGGTAKVGTLLGFEVHVNNDDNGSERDQQITWLTTSTQAWLNPSVFATVVLIPGSSESAGEPVPVDGQTDVLRETALSWRPGQFAATHDVYFGMAFEDVNTASVSSPKGVLVSQGQEAATYDPAGLLELGRTYFWRVDEVNAPPDTTRFKGTVWSFTVEPVGYPIKSIKATASGVSNPLAGPEKTIDGSGLDSLDRHSTEASDMWLSKKNVSPIWIQYEFDAPYKLFQMWVWNQNQLEELDYGLGAYEVTVEHSMDGSTWTALEGVPEFAQATADANYVYNTTVDFGGVQARYVKLTIRSNWGGLKQAGLSEVRFLYIPIKAFGPTPASGATDVALDAAINWRPGREAARHEMYFGTDPNAVALGTAPVKTLTDHRYSLGSPGLEYGRTYYWKVNEVNEARTPTLWEGPVWNFTTIGYSVVDDFESYDDTCSRIFWTWVDQYGYNATPECGGTSAAGNGTGSSVGNAQAPYAEQTVIHSGMQAMPMSFDNTQGPYYSEAQREWTTSQVWTTGGANTLRVYLRGDPAGFIETASGTIIMNGTGTDVWDASDQFRFAYQSLKGNGSMVVRVDRVANTHDWAKAGLMIRDGLDPSAAHTAVFLTPANGVSFQNRATAGSTCTSVAQSGLKTPYWVRLTRTGNTFTAHHSEDGITWVEIVANQTVTVPMANEVYIGLAVTSHAAEVVCGAKFSKVSTTGNVTGSWQGAEIGATQVPGNTPETFYVALQDASGKQKVVSHPDPVIIATGDWEEWNIPLGEFTSAGVNLNSIKKMSLGVGDRTSPRPGGAGKLYIDDIRLTRTVEAANN